MGSGHRGSQYAYAILPRSKMVIYVCVEWIQSHLNFFSLAVKRDEKNP